VVSGLVLLNPRWGPYMEAKKLLVLLVRGEMQGYGLRLTRRYRDVLDRDEVRSAVDLALLRAAERFDACRGPFLVFAMIWVRREVLQLLRRELSWRRRRAEPESAIEPARFDSPHDEAERSQISRLIDAEQHELWRAHVGGGESVRELAATYGKSLRQIQSTIARSQRRLSRVHGPSAAASTRTRRRPPC